MTQTLVIALLVAAALYVIWTFNRLIAMKVRAANAWSDIDVQLKRRSDLIPSLVQTVRGYAAHERAALENVSAARSHAQQSASPAERGRAETEISQGVSRIFALAEAYPDLKADEVFASLHTNLVKTEDDIQSARRYYNAVVRDFNTMLSVVPMSIIAGLFRFRPREFFELKTTAEAASPAVNLKES
jgi:LemA protein